MKKIVIQSLSLLNFKGIRAHEINFINNETFVFGDNGVGKTTIFDAFCWLLFGKNSEGRSDFELKTLDSFNKPIEKIEHEVSSVILVNDSKIKLRRILKESWVKKRGSVTPEFKGNITEYYWNDVPVQQKEFQQNISELLDEQIFKMITNTTAFNALDWKVRRSILSGMVNVTDNEIMIQNAAFVSLMEEIKKHKSVEDFKKMKAASIKKAKEDLQNIPTRIDEVEKNKPIVRDFAGLTLQLEIKQKELASIDEQINDKAKAVDAIIEQRNQHVLKVNSIKTKTVNRENYLQNEASKKVNEEKGAFNEYSLQLKNTEAELITANYNHTIYHNKLQSLEKELSDLVVNISAKREEWAKENAKEFVFNESECTCPTCKRAFDSENIEAKKAELLKNFNTEKQTKLAKITEKGQELAKDKSELEKTISDLKEKIEEVSNKIKHLNEKVIPELKAKVDSLKTDPSADEKKADMIYASMMENDLELVEMKKELSELEKITIEVPTVDTADLKLQKESINAKIDSIKNELAYEQQIKSAEERIKALMEEERNLSQQIANVEKDIILADEFSKAKIETIEARINEKFRFVKFKMFETQINGGEVECCMATINGVPFSDANTASKINAGLDIINTLCEYYQVSAPVFIDNRESIVSLIPTESQIINLVVSKEDKQLRVA